MNTTDPKAPCPLAVMDDDARAAEEWRAGEHGASHAIACGRISGEARAAVAELVAAAAGVIQWEDVSQLDHEWPLVVADLRAALAAFSEVRP